jgi:tetratricopeptide (TPR) repeat protein
MATRIMQIARPLALTRRGEWDPADQYWGDDDTDLDPLIEQVVAAGPRPAFEMEQVIPGMESDDWDMDPVADAAEWHRAGDDRLAARILRGLIAEDERCVDAWVHLGNIALDANRPKAALDLYDTAVAIAEHSLPAGFNGVLPRGLIDNRPFLRALHGLGLCAWRQRRWDDAEAIFTNSVWIDGGDTFTALSCLQAVRSHRRWTRD